MSTAEHPTPLIAEIDAIPVDDLVATLGHSRMLKALGVRKEDLLPAQSDSDLLETLRITHELLTALKETGVLDTFLQLPQADQADFLRLIGTTDDPELRQHRTRTFVSALRESPLADNATDHNERRLP